MIYTVDVYYSKNVTSGEEHFEIPYYYSYSKGMTGQKKPIPSIPPHYKANVSPGKVKESETSLGYDHLSQKTTRQVNILMLSL